MRKIFLYTLLLLSFCAKETSSSLKVVATTSMVECILKEIGNGKIEVVKIVPASMCPGHFDIKPDVAKKILNAKIIVCHGWEPWLSKLKILNSKVILVPINVKGNWMIPTIHAKAMEKVKNVLENLSPENKKFFEKRYNHYTKRLDLLEKRVRERCGIIKGKKVIASQFQKEFLEWLGLNVVMCYGRPEEITPRTLEMLITTGKKENAELIVDNLQSGTFGKKLAESLNIRYVVLSNFPLEGSYERALLENVDKIINALSDH